MVRYPYPWHGPSGLNLDPLACFSRSNTTPCECSSSLWLVPRSTEASWEWLPSLAPRDHRRSGRMEHPCCLNRPGGLRTLTSDNFLPSSTHSLCHAATTAVLLWRNPSSLLSPAATQDLWVERGSAVSTIHFLVERAPFGAPWSFRAALWCSHLQAFYPFTSLPQIPLRS
jgi:hypothetical protein